jgi:hypothetical protein
VSKLVRRGTILCRWEPGAPKLIRVGFVVAALMVAAATLSRVALSGSEPPRCRTAHLKIAARHIAVAGGTIGGYLTFRNDGTTTCRLRGWPTVVAYTAGGVSVVATRTRSTMFGPTVTGVPTVVLKPGSRADAVFTSGDNPSPKTPCTSYRKLRVTPPGDSSSAEVSAWFASLGSWFPACTEMWLSMVVSPTDLYRG